MIGRTIGRFQVRQWISGGRFADVFLVYDPLTNQEFALKLARRKARHQELLQQEARILASLLHEHIVRFYFVDFFEDRLYIVLEYVPGRSLRALLQEKHLLPPEEALRILQETLEGLAYAHQRGILHRDLKPENLLLTREGQVKIADFGLALLFRDEAGLAAAGGTPLYMAPETWEGRFSKASDVWSLGVVLYEMLTGEPPFTGTTLEEIRQRILAGQRPSLRGIRPELARLLEQALQPDPAHRFPDALAFLAALRPLQSGRTLVPTPVQPGPPGTLRPEGLTEEQWTVVREARGPTLVLGGPGTGKTRTLIALIVHLVESEGVDPEEILAVTFTNRSVAEIQERLTQTLGRDRARAVTVGTYHFLALQILAYGGDRLGLPDPFTVAPARLQEEILARILKGWPRPRVRSALKAISTLKRQFLGPKEARTLARSPWEREVAKAYARYQETLYQEGLLDFDDLLFYTHRLLHEHPDVRDDLAHRFRYLLADEFQDINEGQYLLLKALAAGHGNLVVFGDDDQAIYGFRGASSRYMETFQRDFPEARVFYLTRNFRTPAAILRLAQQLIQRNRHRFQKPLEPSVAVENAFALYVAEDEDQEARFVVQRIQELLKAGYTPLEIAVVARTRARLAPVEQHLQRHQLPYNQLGDTPWIQHPLARALVSALRLATGEATADEARQVLEYLLALPGAEATRFLRGFRKRRRFSHPRRVDPAFAERVQALETWIQSYREAPGVQRPVDLLRRLAALRPSSATDDLRALAEQEAVDHLLQTAAGFHRVPDFLNYLNLLQELEPPIRSSGLQVLTAHGAKGTEFPVVFIVGLEQEVFPLRGSLLRKQALEEERRLLYVAITRAQEKLFLSYARRRAGQPQQPSQFLHELLIQRG